MRAGYPHTPGMGAASGREQLGNNGLALCARLVIGLRLEGGGPGEETVEKEFSTHSLFLFFPAINVEIPPHPLT